MTAHSLELLLDPALDAAIRDEWQVLDDAGLPNQGRVGTPTNRPHVTMVAAHSLPSGVDIALTPVAMRLPITLRVGPLVLLGHGDRITLARLVVPSADLLSLHAQTHRLTLAASDGDDVPEIFTHCRPGEWTAHITLARRLLPAGAAHAVSALSATREREAVGTATALRRWNGDTRTEHILAGRAC